MMNNKLKKILLFGIAFTALDQIIKLILNNKVVLYDSIIIIKNFFSITLTHNTGAAFSILNGGRIFLILIAIIVIIALSLYINKTKDIKKIDLFIYSLLMGGIIGNLIDRIVYGYVIDYISLNIFGYYFPIFNFADMCIVISVLLLLTITLKEDLCKK